MTIGFVGMNELVEYMTGYQIHEDPSAQKLALKTLIMMDKIRKSLQTRRARSSPSRELQPSLLPSVLR